MHAVLLADVVYGADVGVVECRDRPRFALEASAQLWTAHKLDRQHLDRDRSVQARVARTIYVAHAITPEGGLDFIGANGYRS
jgi:hypothetical protein